MTVLSSSDRILAACCPESSIDTFEQAARVTEIVSAAHLRGFNGPAYVDQDEIEGEAHERT